MKKKTISRAGSEAQYGPRLAGAVLHHYLENSDDAMAVAYREHAAEAEEQGWHPNTHLGVNLKTILRQDRQAKTGKSYPGLLRRDVPSEEFGYDEHFTFIETAPSTSRKRNPHVFFGRYVTVTCWADGSLHPNLRPMQIGEDFNIDSYAIGVCNELRQALSGLVAKERK